MGEDSNNLNFSRVLLQGISICLLGGIIFWLTEFLVILITLPFSWDYIFVRDGNSIVSTISIILKPYKLSMAFLAYSSISFFTGLICSCIIYFVSKQRNEAKINSLIISVFLAFTFFVFGAFCMNIPLLPQRSIFGSILLFSIFLLGCTALAYWCFKRLIKTGDEKALPMFLALAIAIDLFMFGELNLARELKFKLLNIKGIVLFIVVIALCFGLFHAMRFVFSLKVFRKHTLDRVRKRILLTAITMTLLSGVVVIKESRWVKDVFVKHEGVNLEKPNVVLIVLDTARAENMSLYGYDRKTTPHIDRISEEGVVFNKVVSPSSWTVPSHASIFTGLFPFEHGTDHASAYLPEEMETLAGILKKEGYKTLGYSNNAYVSNFTGLSRDFDDFQEGWRLVKRRHFYQFAYNMLLDFVMRNDPDWLIKDHGANKTTKYVSEWIKHNRKAPFFVFINYIEAHAPYSPPPPYNSAYLPEDIDLEQVNIFSISQECRYIYNLIFQRDFSQTEISVCKALYDGEISYLDSKIWQLYTLLKELNLLDNTLLIITSDHGENLGEHRLFGHSYGLFNTLLDVPLVIRYPESFEPGLVIDNDIQTTDIFYTILHAAGVDRNPSNLGLGESLIKRIKENNYSKVFLASRDKPTNMLRWAKWKQVDASHIDENLATIIFDGYKYIRTSRGAEELYHLDDDPGELHNILSDNREMGSMLRKKLAELLEKAKPMSTVGEKPQMDKETEDELRALGYIN